MTTGSWSTYRTDTVSTACSSSSIIRNGTSVSWTGADSSVKRRPRSTFKERLALFLKNPEALPNGRPKVVLDTVSAASVYGAAQDNIFDTARTQRLKMYDEVPSQGDYGMPHAFSKSWTTYRETVFSWYFPNGQYAGSGTVGNCGFGYNGALKTPWTSSHDYKLLSRMREKVMGSDFNLASFLGAEGLDTLRFFTDTANRIYRSLAAARKLDFRNAHLILTGWGRVTYRSKSLAARERAAQEDIYRSIAEAASGKSRGQGWWSVPASTWLEYHLAVEPLLGDCVAAAEQLAHVTQMPRSLRVQASVTTRNKFTPGSVDLYSPLWTGERKVRKSVVAYFTHTPEPLSFLGFQDPEVTLWNAIPLSFVADYFVPIGSFLEARATAKAMPPGVYITSLKDETNLVSCQGKRQSAIIAPVDQAKQKFKTGSFQRTVSSSLDVPKPRVTPLGAFSSWQRAATVASLVAAFSDRSMVRDLRD